MISLWAVFKNNPELIIIQFHNDEDSPAYRIFSCTTANLSARYSTGKFCRSFYQKQNDRDHSECKKLVVDLAYDMMLY